MAESDVGAPIQEPTPNPEAPGSARLSRAARTTKFWFIVPAALLVLAIAVPLSLGGSALATSGSIPKPAEPELSVPVDFVLTSQTLVTAKCVGTGALSGVETSKVTYRVAGGDGLEATLGSGKVTGKACTYRTTFTGTKAQVFGKVALGIAFPFADPLSFSFTVDAKTPSIVVRLTLE